MSFSFFHRRHRRHDDATLERLAELIVQKLQQATQSEVAGYPEAPAIDQVLANIAGTTEQLDLLRQAFLLLEKNQQTIQHAQQSLTISQRQVMETLQSAFELIETIARQTQPKKTKRKAGEEVVESDTIPPQHPAPPPLPEDPQMI